MKRCITFRAQANARPGDPGRQGNRVAVHVATAWAVALLVLGGMSSRAADLTAIEFQAAFVSKVIPYVTWPEKTFASDEAPLVIGLFGGDPFDGLLQKLVANEKFEGRRIEVKVLTNTTRLELCPLIFVRGDRLADWYKLAEQGIPAGILTIAADDSGEFLRKGGGFNLLTTERKLEIDRRNVHRAGLRVSSRLLRIAKVQ